MNIKELTPYLEDMVLDFLVYDRKEDEDLQMGDIEKSICDGKLTIDEIVLKIKDILKESIIQKGRGLK